MNEEIIKFENPFCNGCTVTRVVDESSRSSAQMIELLSHNELVDENEWYVLFENGTLIKKGRSRIATSDYLNGKKFLSINKFYEKV